MECKPLGVIRFKNEELILSAPLKNLDFVNLDDVVNLPFNLLIEIINFFKFKNEYDVVSTDLNNILRVSIAYKILIRSSHLYKEHYAFMRLFKLI